MKTTEQLQTEFGLTRTEFKAMETKFLRDDPNVKKAYNFRLLAVFFAMFGGLILARTLLPTQSWLVHSAFGLICTWFPYWVMTVYATNPTLADAIKETEQAVTPNA